MPINLTVDKARGFVLAEYTGTITDAELLSAWRSFYQGDVWEPGLSELHDLSEADPSAVTAGALRELADFSGTLLKRRGVQPFKVAIYAPGALPYGLARMYEAMANDSPEAIRVCRTLEEAESWLHGGTSR